MKHPCNLLANIIRTLANTLARKSGSGQLLPDRTPSKGLLRSRECSGQAVRILASLLAALSADSRVEAAPSKHESNERDEAHNSTRSPWTRDGLSLKDIPGILC